MLKNILLIGVVSTLFSGLLNASELKLGDIKEVKFKNRYLVDNIILVKDESVNTEVNDIEVLCFNESVNTNTCFDYGFGKVFQITQTVNFDLNEKKTKKITKHFIENLEKQGFVEEDTEFLDFKDYKNIYSKEDSLYAFKIENFKIKSITTTKKLQTEKEAYISKMKEEDFGLIFDKSLKYIK